MSSQLERSAIEWFAHEFIILNKFMNLMMDLFVASNCVFFYRHTIWFASTVCQTKSRQ